LGDFVERKKLPGGKVLKREMDRLQSQINCISGVIDRPLKEFDLKAIISACRTARSAIQLCQTAVNEVQKEVKHELKKKSK
jgi:hypothetical protein